MQSIALKCRQLQYRQSWRLLTALCFSITPMFCPHNIKAAAGEFLESTEAYEVSFGMSFWIFDWCGDQVAGEMFRKAVAEKFDHCPFSDKARAHFRERTSILRTEAAAMMNKYIIERGGLPERLEGIVMSCREQLSMPQYQESRRKLEQYDRGKVAFGDIIPESCDLSSGAP
jgi:hypothetical protein